MVVWNCGSSGRSAGSGGAGGGHHGLLGKALHFVTSDCGKAIGVAIGTGALDIGSLFVGGEELTVAGRYGALAFKEAFGRMAIDLSGTRLLNGVEVIGPKLVGAAGQAASDATRVASTSAAQYGGEHVATSTGLNLSASHQGFHVSLMDFVPGHATYVAGSRAIDACSSH
jgi:hypothetical protein